jgi:hypothetical protein
LAAEALGTEVLVASIEALNAAGSIHDSLLACVERVRSGRDFNVENRIILSVFPLDGFGA